MSVSKHLNHIREIIEGRGFRYDWIARNVLGISPQNFYNKLTGRSRFTEAQKERLARFLEVPVDELFPEVPEAVREA